MAKKQPPRLGTDDQGNITSITTQTVEASEELTDRQSTPCRSSFRRVA